MQRRAFLGSLFATLSVAAGGSAGAENDTAAQFIDLERRTGGRLGVAAIDTGRGRIIAYRAHERFAMCSTFKVLAAAAVLHRVDLGAEQLARRVSYAKSDLLEYAPIAREHVAQGFMTVRELCAAAIEYSDNTAANLLLRTIGGPAALTRYARTLGDAATMLNRTEPELNTAIPGDLRDTTTPAAMAADMRKVLLGSELSAGSRALLLAWLVGCRTGGALLRAGFPASWRAGDKSGMGGAHNTFGDSDTRNDIAIAWPPHGAPVIVAAYLTGCRLRAARRDAVLAQVGRIAAASGR